MSWVDDLSETVDEIFDTTWDCRDGTVVPEAEDVALKDGAVKLNATFLYADLAGSSLLAKACPWQTTAKIIRAYLDCATRLIRAYDGHIRSFDGDRVMGVFIGDRKNTNATKCGREIFWATEKIIAPKATEKFSSIRNNGIQIRQCVGIDTGDSHAVRAGIRASNDLIWVGKAPSFAAKLSDIRNHPYCVFISKAVYNVIPDSEKLNTDGSNIWEARTFEFAGEKESIYRTKWMRRP